MATLPCISLPLPDLRAGLVDLLRLFAITFPLSGLRSRVPFPAGDGNGEIRAQDLAQTARVALLRGDQLRVVVGVHRQGLLRAQGDADIALLAPVVVEDDLVSRFFLQGGGTFSTPFSYVASRHLNSVLPVSAAMVTHCRSATKGGALPRRVGAKLHLVLPPMKQYAPLTWPVCGLLRLAAGGW
jgi:hypothetical protein